jgi:ketosteroid isomerase-like protein
MPDAQWADARHHVLAPDYGVSEWTLTGTLSDGRRLEVNGCDFLTVRDGKIIRKNSYRKNRPPIPVQTERNA